MLDRRLLRDTPGEIKRKLAARGPEYAEVVDHILELDAEERSVQVELDGLREKRNTVSKEIGRHLKAGEKDIAEEKKGYVKMVNESIAIVEARFSTIQDERMNLLATLPNLPDESVPVGGALAKRTIKEWGTPRLFNFEVQDHVALAASLKLVDFSASARVSGSGFQFYTGRGAQLQRALINYMLDQHLQRHGYTEIRPPFLVKADAPFGTGQLPKFKEEMYHVYVPLEEFSHATAGDPDFYLIPTAEVPVCNYYRDTILPAGRLPFKFVAYSPCWRVEAGSYGREARGLMRVHQFEKVELVVICEPEQSYDFLEKMTLEAEHILEALELPYRRTLLPTGDMGFQASKTYDLEVYAPAADDWLEVSSASNTLDFQSRRANIRFRREEGGRPEFVHMLNASGLALPRVMIALLENYQLENGNVAVPEPLQRYIGRQKYLTPDDTDMLYVD